jgi:hypothetical protein
MSIVYFIFYNEEHLLIQIHFKVQIISFLLGINKPFYFSKVLYHNSINIYGKYAKLITIMDGEKEK